jgi:hypothetical protein
MKTIKTKNGTIRRVKDNEAELGIKSSGWIYVPKSEWKNLVKPNEEPIIEKKSKKKVS